MAFNEDIVKRAKANSYFREADKPATVMTDETETPADSPRHVFVGIGAWSGRMVVASQYLELAVEYLRQRLAAQETEEIVTSEDLGIERVRISPDY